MKNVANYRVPQGAEKMIKRQASKQGKSKKTPATLKLLVQALGHGGMAYYHAAQYAGITFQTFNNWMRAGEAVEERMDAGEDWEDLSQKEQWDYTVYKECRDAEGEGIQTHIKKIATDKSWQARMTLLERRYPQHYGRRADVNVRGGVAVLNITSEDLAQAAINAEEFEQLMFGDDNETEGS